MKNLTLLLIPLHKVYIYKIYFIEFSMLNMRMGSLAIAIIYFLIENDSEIIN